MGQSYRPSLTCALLPHLESTGGSRWGRQLLGKPLVVVLTSLKIPAPGDIGSGHGKGPKQMLPVGSLLPNPTPTACHPELLF